MYKCFAIFCFWLEKLLPLALLLKRFGTMLVPTGFFWGLSFLDVFEIFAISMILGEDVFVYTIAWRALQDPIGADRVLMRALISRCVWMLWNLFAFKRGYLCLRLSLEVLWNPVGADFELFLNNFANLLLSRGITSVSSNTLERHQFRIKV